MTHFWIRLCRLCTKHYITIPLYMIVTSNFDQIQTFLYLKTTSWQLFVTSFLPFSFLKDMESSGYWSIKFDVSKFVSDMVKIYVNICFLNRPIFYQFRITFSLIGVRIKWGGEVFFFSSVLCRNKTKQTRLE